MTNPAHIPVAAITTLGRARQATRRQVDALMESIQEIGLLNPVTVCRTDAGYALVAGLHRLEACRALGWVEIPAAVTELDEQRRIIAECDENLCAPTLTAAERAEFTRRRKAAYEALHPETAHGAIGNGREKSRQLGDSTSAPRFTTDTAAATGQSERVVQRDAERGEKVCDEALELICGSKLDTGRYLDSIKNMEAEEQIARVRADLAEPRPAPPPTPVPAEPEPAKDKERQSLSRLTEEALIDEIVGLRADLVEMKQKLRAAIAERDDARAKLKEATSGDMGRALGNAQRRAEQFAGRVNELLATNKRMEFRLNAAEKRVKELESMPVAMGAP